MNANVKLFEQADLHWLGLGDTSLLTLDDPFKDWLSDDPHQLMKNTVAILAQPKYFSYTCKVLFNIDIAPFQQAVLWQMWHHQFPLMVANRGFGKSFMLALYLMLRAIFTPGIKIVVVGAAFRQAKVIFEYADWLYKQSKILPSLYDDGTKDKRKGPRRDIDRCEINLGDSKITFLPLGDGGTIRGFRSQITVVDEFAIVPKEVFENVVAGFGSVSMSPIEKMKDEARKDYLRQQGLEVEETDDSLGLKGNQLIIAGTAYYAFNHFHDYWLRYKNIIESRGDPHRLEEVFDGAIPDDFNWKDFCVIRIPWTLVPKGYLDTKQISRSKATQHSTSFLMEYEACFSADSKGYFKRSLIDSCTITTGRPIDLPGVGIVNFTSVLVGDPNKRYVIAVDPASEVDNLCIAVIELWQGHRRLVYMWTTNKAKHRLRLKKGITKNQNYFEDCARKVRDVMKVFPCERLIVDSQGGGYVLAENWRDTAKLVEGEQPIWEIIEEGKEKETDNFPGLHILEFATFAKAEWVAEANTGLKKDMEDKALLFPRYDTIALFDSYEQDKENSLIDPDEPEADLLYDTLEACAEEIRMMYDELASIEHTRTAATGRDRWDTPETLKGGGKRERQRKDRYTALLMANMAARTIQTQFPTIAYNAVGGVAHNTGVVGQRQEGYGRLYVGPDWFTSKVGGRTQFRAIKRR